jgi:hypothetical protein
VVEEAVEVEAVAVEERQHLLEFQAPTILV